MADDDAELIARIRIGREERGLEYKGTRGPISFAWGSSARVNATIARTAMAMANIGGGDIVIGMDEDPPGRWQPNGASDDVVDSYQQDRVQEYVNQRADPYVRLAVHHVPYQERRFIIIRVAGFDELPVVCTKPMGIVLRQGAVYTRSFTVNATVEIQSQSEMRELLDRAISIGVRKRLRELEPLFEAARRITAGTAVPTDDERRFEEQQDEP